MSAQDMLAQDWSLQDKSLQLWLVQDIEFHDMSDLAAFAQLIASNDWPEPPLADVRNRSSPRFGLGA